jgi:hypothetical protein
MAPLGRRRDPPMAMPVRVPVRSELRSAVRISPRKSSRGGRALRRGPDPSARTFFGSAKSAVPRPSHVSSWSHKPTFDRVLHRSWRGTSDERLIAQPQVSRDTHKDQNARHTAPTRPHQLRTPRGPGPAAQRSVGSRRVNLQPRMNTSFLYPIPCARTSHSRRGRDTSTRVRAPVEGSFRARAFGCLRTLGGAPANISAMRRSGAGAWWNRRITWIDALPLARPV